MKQRLLHNIGLKILSLALAVIAWFLIMNVADPVISKSFNNIPVQIINDDVITSRGYSYTVESGERVNIRVRGKKTIVGELTEADFKATADFLTLNEMYMADITVECTASHADDIEITKRTEAMAVKRENQATQSFRVKVHLTGSVADGYQYVQSEISTDTIQVTGSVTQIAEVSELAVRINISDRTESFTDTYTVVAYDMHGNVIDSRRLSFSDEDVRVTVDIWPVREIPVEALTVGEPATGYYVSSVECSPLTCKLAADESLFKRLSTLVISCHVLGAESDVMEKINIEDYLHTLGFKNCIITDDLRSITVTAHIDKMAERRVTFTEQDIDMRNVPKGLSCTLYSIWNADLTVSGPASEIETIDASDLDLYIDLSGCQEGTYSRKIYSDYEGDLLVTPGSVMVKLTKK